MRALKQPGNIDVFILCGGQGKRLKRICRNTPKPMVKMGKIPFLDILIRYLFSLGFRRFILGTGYRADVIQEHFKGKITCAKITFSRENKPLGTGGAVKKAAKLIQSNPFIVMNGDSFCRFDPAEFLRFHKRKNALVSILLRQVSNSADFGRVTVDRSWRITGFNEKKRTAVKSFVNAGIYIFDKKAFAPMPKVKEFSLEFDFFPRLAGNKIFGYRQKGSFIDIGTPKRLLDAKRYFAEINNG